MEIEQIVEYLLKHTSLYPRKHLYPGERTSSAFKPLEPKSQLLLIWKATCDYVKEQLMNYKGVNLKGFGAFTYEIHQTLPKLGIDVANSQGKSFQQLLYEKKSQHILRPCFLVDPKISNILSRFNHKEEITKPNSQKSVYEKGFKMKYFNTVPVCAATFINKKVVEDGIKAIFNVIYDLISLERRLCIKTGFCNINFFDKNMNYSFSPEIINLTKDLINSEEKFKNGVTPINKMWTVSKAEKWGESVMSQVIERPQSPLIKTVDNKSQMLKIMSLDMNSTFTGY